MFFRRLGSVRVIEPPLLSIIRDLSSVFQVLVSSVLCVLIQGAVTGLRKKSKALRDTRIERVRYVMNRQLSTTDYGKLGLIKVDFSSCCRLPLLARFMNATAPPKPAVILAAPINVEESRAQRLQRQQARFRDRGGQVILV